MNYVDDGQHVPPDFVECVLDLNKVDAEWEKWWPDYISPGGFPSNLNMPQHMKNKNKARYDKVLVEVKAGTIYYPVVCLDEDGCFKIVHGNHRIAACRDNGMSHITVMAHHAQANAIRLQLG
jgi:hypothetical protein